MIKKLVIIMSVMTISVLLNGMDLVHLNKLKRTGTADKGPESRGQEVPDNKQDVRLNLDNLPEPLLFASNGKPSIKKLKHVNHLKSQQSIYRVSTGRGSNDTQKERKMNNDNTTLKNSDKKEEDIFDINDSSSTMMRDTVGTKKTGSVFEDLLPNNSFSSQNMWDMLKKANPKLYNYAIDNQLSINEVLNCPYDFEAINPQIHNLLNQLAKKKLLPLNKMMEYVHLVETCNIEPEALGELLQTHHNLSNDYTGLLVKKFEGIQKNDSDKYLSLALDFITRTCDEGGLKGPSPLHETHVAIQNDTISEKKRQLLYSIIGHVVTIVGIVATGAWAIYGQISGTTNPTNAPTNAPTFAPTNAPTFAPV